MKYLYIKLLIFALDAIWATIHSSNNENFPPLLEKASDVAENSYSPESIKNPTDYSKHIKQIDARAVDTVINKASFLPNIKYEENFNTEGGVSSSILTESLKNNIDEINTDPILNMANRRVQTHKVRVHSGSESGSSSSFEKRIWKEEWNANWMQKKFEAINSSQPRGDVANMVAARPWGVACGDPNQHDVAWGSCTLPMECDAEYRLYRGDYFCGRNSFICCAVILTNYDLYQGVDVSFEDSSKSTDSDEKDLDSIESNRKKLRDERKRRKKARARRKQAIKKSIVKIVKEITKIMNRAYLNTTVQRKRRTKDLEKYVHELKERFKEDRGSAVLLHQYASVKADEDLQNKLDQIKDVNEEFMANETFRGIIVNGTVSEDKLAALLRVRPRLAKILTDMRTDGQKDNIAQNITDKQNKVHRDIEGKKPKRRTDIQMNNDNLKPKIIQRRTDEKRLGDRKKPNIIVIQTDEEVREKEDKTKTKRRKDGNKQRFKKKHILEYDIEFGQLYY